MAWYDLEEETTTAPKEQAIPVSRLVGTVSGAPPEQGIPVNRLRAQGQFLNEPPPRTPGEEFDIGLDRGEDQLRGLGYGLVGLMSDALGVKAGADWGYDNYRQAMEEAATKEASVQDPFSEIGNFSDAGRYAVGLLGEQIPQLVTSLIGGGIGGMVGKSVAKKIVANEVLKRVAAGTAATAAEREVADEVTKSILRKAVAGKAAQESAEGGLGPALDLALKGQVAQAGASGFTAQLASVPVTAGAVARQAAQNTLASGVRRGAVSGAYLANLGQIAGGTYGQVRDETGEGGAGAVGASLATAVPGAALDTLSELFIASRVPGINRILGRSVNVEAKPLKLLPRVGLGAARTAAVGSPLEGATEYLQTGLEQAAVGIADPNQTVEQRLTAPGAERERRIAAAAGATIGGMLGGGAGTLEALAPRTKQKLDQLNPPEDPETQTPPVGDRRLDVGDWSDEVDIDGLKMRFSPSIAAALPRSGGWAVFNPPEELGIEGMSNPVDSGSRFGVAAYLRGDTEDGAALVTRAQDALSQLRGGGQNESLGVGFDDSEDEEETEASTLAPIQTTMPRPEARRGIGGQSTVVDPDQNAKSVQAAVNMLRRAQNTVAFQTRKLEELRQRRASREELAAAEAELADAQNQLAGFTRPTIEFQGARGVVQEIDPKDGSLRVDFGRKKTQSVEENRPSPLPWESARPEVVGTEEVAALETITPDRFGQVNLVGEDVLTEEAERRQTEAEIEQLLKELDEEVLTLGDPEEQERADKEARIAMLRERLSGRLAANETIPEFKTRREEMKKARAAREAEIRKSFDGSAVGNMQQGDKASVFIGDRLVAATFQARTNVDGEPGIRLRVDENSGRLQKGQMISLRPEQFRNVGFRVQMPREVNDEAEFNQRLRGAKSISDLAQLTGGLLRAGKTHKLKVGGLTYRVTYLQDSRKATEEEQALSAAAQEEVRAAEREVRELEKSVPDSTALAEAQERLERVRAAAVLLKRPTYAKFDFVATPPVRPKAREEIAEQVKPASREEILTRLRAEEAPVFGLSGVDNEVRERDLQRRADQLFAAEQRKVDRRYNAEQANFNTSYIAFKQSVLEAMDAGHAVHLTPETVEQMDDRMSANELIERLQSDPDADIQNRVPVDPLGRPLGEAVPTVVKMTWRGRDGRQVPYNVTQGSRRTKAGVVQNPIDLEIKAVPIPFSERERDRQRNLIRQELEAEAQLLQEQADERGELLAKISLAQREVQQKEAAARSLQERLAQRDTLNTEINTLRGLLAQTLPAQEAQADSVAERRNQIKEENDRSIKADDRIRKQIRETEAEIEKKFAAATREGNSPSYSARMLNERDKLTEERDRLRAKLKESDAARKARRAEDKQLEKQANDEKVRQREARAAQRRAFQAEQRRLKSSLAAKERQLANFDLVPMDDRPVKELRAAQDELQKLQSQRNSLDADQAMKRLELARKKKSYQPTPFDKPLRGLGSFAKVYETDPLRQIEAEQARIKPRLQSAENVAELQREIAELPEADRVIINEIQALLSSVFPGVDFYVARDQIMSYLGRGLSQPLGQSEQEEVLGTALTLATNSAANNFMRVLEARKARGGAPSQIDPAEQVRLTKLFVTELNKVLRKRLETQVKKASPSEERMMAIFDPENGAIALGVSVSDIQDILGSEPEVALEKLDRLRRRGTRDVTFESDAIKAQKKEIEELSKSLDPDSTALKEARARLAQMNRDAKRGMVDPTRLKPLWTKLHAMIESKTQSLAAGTLGRKTRARAARAIGGVTSADLATAAKNLQDTLKTADKNQAEREARLLGNIVGLMRDFYNGTNDTKGFNPLRAAANAVDTARKRVERDRPNRVKLEFGAREEAAVADQAFTALEQDEQEAMDAQNLSADAKLLGSGSGRLPPALLRRESYGYLRSIPPEELAVVHRAGGLIDSPFKKRLWYDDKTGTNLKRFEAALADLNKLKNLPPDLMAIAEKHFARLRDIPNLPPTETTPTDETEIELRTTPPGVTDPGTRGLQRTKPSGAASDKPRFTIAPSPVSGTGLDLSSLSDSELLRLGAVSDSLGGQLVFDDDGGLPSVGEPDAGRPGGVSRTADGSTARPRVRQPLPKSDIRRLAAKATRTFVEMFTGKKLPADVFGDDEVYQIYSAIQTTAKGAETTLAAGGNIISQTPQPFADILSRKGGFELLTGMIEASRSQSNSQERLDLLRKNVGALAEARAFAGPRAFFNHVANDAKLPQNVRLLARELARFDGRLDWNDNVAFQIASFGRNFAAEPLTRKEIERRIKEETKDGRRVFSFVRNGKRVFVPVPERPADALERKEQIVEEMRRAIIMDKMVPWAGRMVVNQDGAFTVYVNVNGVHDTRPGGAVATTLHEFQHIILKAKLDRLTELNPVESAALDNIEAMRREAVMAEAKRRGIAGDFEAVNAQLEALSRAEANQTLAALTRTQEFIIEATGNPEVFKLLSELGFGNGDLKGDPQFTGALSRLWDSVATLESGVKVEANSPLGRAFRDSYLLTYSSLGDPDKEYGYDAQPVEGTAQSLARDIRQMNPASAQAVQSASRRITFTVPQLVKNSLAAELAAAAEQEQFIREQLEEKDLAGTSEDRNALARAFSALREKEAQEEAAREKANQASLAQGRRPVRVPARVPNTPTQTQTTTTTPPRAETPPPAANRWTSPVVAQLLGLTEETPTMSEKEAAEEERMMETRRRQIAAMALEANEEDFVAAVNEARNNPDILMPEREVDPVALYYVSRSRAARELDFARTLGYADETPPQEQLDEDIKSTLEELETARGSGTEAQVNALQARLAAQRGVSISANVENEITAAIRELPTQEQIESAERRGDTARVAELRRQLETPEQRAQVDERLRQLGNALDAVRASLLASGLRVQDGVPVVGRARVSRGRFPFTSREYMDMANSAERNGNAKSAAELRATAEEARQVEVAMERAAKEAAKARAREAKNAARRQAKAGQQTKESRGSALLEKFKITPKPKKQARPAPDPEPEPEPPKPGKKKVIEAPTADEIEADVEVAMTGLQWGAWRQVQTGDGPKWARDAKIPKDAPFWKDYHKNKEMRRSRGLVPSGNKKDGWWLTQFSAPAGTPDPNPEVNPDDRSEFSTAAAEIDALLDEEISNEEFLSLGGNLSDAFKRLEDALLDLSVSRKEPNNARFADQLNDKSLSRLARELDAAQSAAQDAKRELFRYRDLPWRMLSFGKRRALRNLWEPLEERAEALRREFFRLSGPAFDAEVKRMVESVKDAANEVIDKANVIEATEIINRPDEFLGDDSDDYLSLGGSLFGAANRVFRNEVTPTETGGTYVREKLIQAVNPNMDRRGTDLYLKRQFAINAEARRADQLMRVLAKQLKAAAKEGVKIDPRTVTTSIGRLTNPLTEDQEREIATVGLTDPKAAAALKDTYRRKNWEDFRQTQKRARLSLPEDIRATAVEMSGHLESLQRLLQETGILTGDLMLEVEASLGMWLNRSYAIFDNPKWPAIIRRNEKIIGDARRGIRDYLVTLKAEELRDNAADDGIVLPLGEAKSMAAKSVTAADVEAQLEFFLSRGEDSPVVKILSGRFVKKNLSILKTRGQIAPWLQKLWGVYDDPETSYGKSVLKLSNLIYTHLFLRDLRLLGLTEGWFSAAPRVSKMEDGSFVVRNSTGNIVFQSENKDEADDYVNQLGYEPPPGFVKVGAKGNDRLAPMDDIYAKKEIAEALAEMFPADTRDQLPWVLQAGAAATGFTLMTATVGSMVTQVRNYGSVWLKYLSSSGLNFNIDAIKEAHSLAWQDQFTKFGTPEKAKEKIDDAVKRGVFGESVAVNMIRDLVSDFRNLSEAARQGQNKWERAFDTIVRRPGVAVYDFAQGTYGMSDNIGRGLVYFTEIDNYRKAFPDMPLEEIKDRAAKISRDIYWTYSEAPRWVQDLKRGPGLFVAPFITFTTEVVRTSINTLKLAYDEINSGNPELRKLGYRRAAGFFAVNVALPYAVSSAFLAMSGLSSEDEEDLRKFLPSWQKNNQLWLLGREGNKIRFWDGSFFFPNEYMAKPFTAFMRALGGSEDITSGLAKGGAEAMREMLNPFLSEQLLAGAVMDVVRNTTATGSRVYNPQDSLNNIVAAVGQHLATPFVPGTLRSLNRVWLGMTGEVSDTGRSYSAFQEARAMLIGQRIGEVDVAQALGFRVSEFNRNRRDATSLFNRVALSSGTVNPGETADAYTRMNLAQLRLVGELRDVYTAARRLGLSDAAATEKLRALGASQETVEQVRTGIYRPPEPSKDARLELERRGERARLAEMDAAFRSAQTEQLD